MLKLHKSEQAGDVEITPEMVKAGVKVDRMNCWYDLADEDEHVKGIFEAMWSARPVNAPR